MTDQGEDPKRVQATETSVELLEYIRENGWSSLSEISDGLSIAKSTVHRHLTTLEQLELIAEENGEYRIAFRILDFGETARSRWPYYTQIREAVKTIANQTNERAQFVVAEHGTGICLCRYSGDHAVDTAPSVGMGMPLHATAAGKAILAFDDTSNHRKFAKGGFEASTHRTITDAEALQEEIQTVRERNYAVNRDEHIFGLTAFGAPVRSPDSGVLGAISVSGPTSRLNDPEAEKSVITELLGTTNELELNIAHADDS